MTTDHRDHDLRERALRLGLHGLLANWDDVKDAAWLPAVLGTKIPSARGEASTAASRMRGSVASSRSPTTIGNGRKRSTNPPSTTSSN